MLFKRGKPLYVGIAKDNNGKERGTTILGATFSLFPEDYKKKDFSAERNNKERCKNWFEVERNKKGFRWTILASEDYNLNVFDEFLETQKLIKNYLMTKDGKGIWAPELKIFIYGNLKQDTELTIRKDLLGVKGIEKITIENAIPGNPEQGKIEKRISCPEVSYGAKVLTNLCHDTNGNCFLQKSKYFVL